MNDAEFDEHLTAAVVELCERASEPLPWLGSAAASNLAAEVASAADEPTWLATDVPDIDRRRPLLVGVMVVAVALAGAFVFFANRSERTYVSNAPAEVVSDDGRLYLLPPIGTDLSAGVDYSTDPSVDEGSAMVVGRPTATGFDRLAVVTHLTTGPTFGASRGEDITIAGRTLQEPSYNDIHVMGVVAEQLPDGGWLEYTTSGGRSLMAEVVAATTFEDGQIVFEETETGLRRLADVDDVSPPLATNLSYPSFQAGQEGEPRDKWFTVITWPSTDPDEVLVYGAILGTGLQEIEVRGSPGYLITGIPSGGRDATGLVWHSPSGHAVALFTALPKAAALTFAANLRSVDEATWRAELEPLGNGD